MPRLYIDEYTRILSGRHVSIACREGILRDHFDGIIQDIKFLNRQGILTTLFHNMANRFANQKHFQTLADRLPSTHIVRVPANTDFYTAVLAQNPVYKLIFLERKPLTDPKGHRINAVDPHRIRNEWHSYGDLIANASFKSTLEKICERIDKGHLDRVHILPVRKNTIKHELFTVEGTGTLIANNFKESFDPITNDDDGQFVAAILKLYNTDGYLKPRGERYIATYSDHFFVTRIDGIVVGCVELIPIDNQTAELGALAISTRFRGQRIGVFTVQAFLAEARRQGYLAVISLTRNPRLQSLFVRLGFTQHSPQRLKKRQARSKETPMFLKEVL